jgi:hypothetical protein
MGCNEQKLCYIYLLTRRSLPVADELLSVLIAATIVPRTSTSHKSYSFLFGIGVKDRDDNISDLD